MPPSDKIDPTLRAYMEGWPTNEGDKRADEEYQRHYAERWADAVLRAGTPRMPVTAQPVGPAPNAGPSVQYVAANGMPVPMVPAAPMAAPPVAPMAPVVVQPSQPSPAMVADAISGAARAPHYPSKSGMAPDVEARLKALMAYRAANPGPPSYFGDAQPTPVQVIQPPPEQVAMRILNAK
jgi:hypothetical protein